MAIGCILLAFAIRFCLSPVVGDELPFMLFIPAVLVAVWYGGALQGALALFAGFLLAECFFIPWKGLRGLAEFVEIIRSVRYLFTAAVGIGLMEFLHHARRRTQAAVEAAQQEVARRRHSEDQLRAAQAQLSRHAEDLELRVAERTARLSDTVHSLENLLYHIAHNFRAPLRAIEGYSTVLLDEYGPVLDLKGRSYATRLSAAANRMDNLVLDLLEYGRLTHVDLALTNLDLCKAVEAALGEIAIQCRRLQAQVQVTGPFPDVRANARVLDQVLFNLLDNALKFVVPGTKPHLQVWAETRGANVRLYVQDNGIGIDPEHHQRIFRAFERLHSTQAYEGTGIGLAIVQEGMQRMQGSAGVRSHLGEGSRFWVEFMAATHPSPPS